MEKPVKEMKRKAIEWEKIFASHLSNKGLTSWALKKNLPKINSKKVEVPLENGQKTEIDISEKRNIDSK